MKETKVQMYETVITLTNGIEIKTSQIDRYWKLLRQNILLINKSRWKTQVVLILKMVKE